MTPVRGLLAFSLLLGVCALLASGCSGDAKQAEAAAATAAPKPHCPGRAGWQRLANRIDAPVYCPGWLPDPQNRSLMRYFDGALWTRYARPR